MFWFTKASATREECDNHKPNDPIPTQRRVCFYHKTSDEQYKIFADDKYWDHFKNDIGQPSRKKLSIVQIRKYNDKNKKTDHGSCRKCGGQFASINAQNVIDSIHFFKCWCVKAQELALSSRYYIYMLSCGL